MDRTVRRAYLSLASRVVKLRKTKGFAWAGFEIAFGFMLSNGLMESETTCWISCTTRYSVSASARISKNTGFMLPKVVLEIRADADTEYRVVQEIQQVVSDSINPFDGMKPKAISNPAQAKPFVFLNFTTRDAKDK